MKLQYLDKENMQSINFFYFVYYDKFMTDM